jgi:hypothetical protein
MNIVVSKFSKELDKFFKLEQMFDGTTTKILKDNTRLLMPIDLRGIKQSLMKIQLNRNGNWSYEILEIAKNESPQIHVFILHTMRYIRPKIDKKNFKFVYDGEQKG